MVNYATKYLNQTVSIKIDRQLGTKHPRHNMYCRDSKQHLIKLRAQL